MFDRFKRREVLDPTPVKIPLKYTNIDQRDTVRQFIRQELSRRVADAGHESFEEADDFDVADDYDPTSPYEIEFEGLPIAELKRREAAAKAAEPPASPTSEGVKEPPPQQEAKEPK